jgi:hypothetical protein
VHVAHINIGRLARCPLASVSKILNVAGTCRKLCQPLKGKQFYCSHGVYTEVLNDLRVVLKESAAMETGTINTVGKAETNEEFHEQRRLQRNSSNDQFKNLINPLCRPLGYKTRGYCRSSSFQRETEMQFEHNQGENSNDRTEGELQQPPTSQTGRPPPIFLASTTNLMQVQKQLKCFVNDNFEFRSTRNGTRFVPQKWQIFSRIIRL